jgi:hypothetical protein
VVVQRATWKTLVDMLYLDAATHSLIGGDEVYNDASRSALGGLLIHTRFFNIKKKVFTQYPCFVVITLP